MTPDRSYQDAGIAFLRQRRRAILADDAGLGKSRQAILAANAEGYDRVLIICPAIGRVSWLTELRKWDSTQRAICTYKSRGKIPTGRVALIVTYDAFSNKKSLAKLRQALQAVAAFGDAAGRFDLAVLDEAHALKTPSANRTQAIYGRRMDFAGSPLADCHAVWVMSATLTPTDASELYTHIKAVLPEVMADLLSGRPQTATNFTAAFCHTQRTPFGTRVLGNNKKAIPRLRAALKPHILSRRKADVAKDLEPITCLDLPLEVTWTSREERLAIETYLTGMLPEDANEEDDEAYLALLGQSLADPAFSGQRRALGLLKTPPAVEWITDFLDSNPGKKIIVFAHHRDVLERLKTALEKYSPVLIMGGTAPTKSVEAVERFQGEVDCRVFLGQTMACGTSLTLTAAHYVLVLEPEGSPVYNYQAISRAHRIGQTEPVFAYFASAHGTLDTKNSQMLRRRAQDHMDLHGFAPEGFSPPTI